MFFEEIIENLVIGSEMEALEASVTESLISSLVDSFNQSLQTVSESILTMIGSLVPIILFVLGALLVISIGIAVFKYFVNDNSVVSAAVSPYYDFLQDNFDSIVESYESGEFDTNEFLEIFDDIDGGIR